MSISDFPNLKKGPAVFWNALTESAKKLFQPNGIFYWAGRAKKEAEINGTIGSIVGTDKELFGTNKNEKFTFYIPALKNYFDDNPQDIAPYAPIAGLPEFRKAWKNWIITKGNNAKNLPSGSINVENAITLPAVVPGITFGLYFCGRLFLDRGEYVVSPNKKWGNYTSIISRNLGAKFASFRVFDENKQFNVKGMLEQMEFSIKEQDKVVMILNFPNNPTGFIPGKDEAKKIIEAVDEFATKHKKPVVVISDDAYEGYVYNNEGIDVSLFYEFVKKNNEYIVPIKLDGASKEMLLYGARIGCVTLGVCDKWFTPDDKEGFLNEIENKFQAVIRSTTSNSNRYAQTLLARMFSSGIEKILDSRKKIIEIVQERYSILNGLLSEVEKETPSISVDPNAGGFFLFMNIDNKVKAPDFNEHLLKKYKTGLIPISNDALGINGLRIAYSSIPKEQLPILVENIKNSIKDLGL